MDIRVKDLTHQYSCQVTALKGINLEIFAGDCLAIVGENGAGKTTLAKQLNGLLKPTQGEVWIGEENIAKLTPAKIARFVGYAFQNPDQQLFASKVLDEVRFGPSNLGFTPREIDDFIYKALEAVGLEDQLEKHPYDLHLADRKLLSLAAVLAMQTPVVIFDEPTTGQDAHHIQKIGSIIKGIQDQGRTAITISHDLDFCASYFERVIVLRGGEIIADGQASEVLLKTEILASAAVKPPQLVRLAQELDLDYFAATPSEFVHGLKDRKK
jgi:energy-coupling factor transport system ATP-binding protein